MKKKCLMNWGLTLGFFILFVLWTLLVCLIDVAPIGPNQSTVGFATLNGFIHNLTGVHMPLYTVTDWLGLVPFGIVFGFAILGLIQLIQRKSIWKVDRGILRLGGFYIAVMAVYLLFETLVINYRPILINGVLEPSYPSSTTFLVLCVIPTAAMQWKHRIKIRWLWKCVYFLCVIFSSFMVIARLVSGVHWFTDIVGGILISTALVKLYASFLPTSNIT